MPILHRRDVPRDEHLDRPAIGILGHGVLPDAVPVGAELVFVGDGLVLDAVREHDHEVVADATVAVEVDVEIDAVVGAAGIARGDLAGARDVRRLGVAECDRKALRRGQDPGFGGIRRRRARQRLRQPEIADVPCAGPFGRIDMTIDHDGTGSPGGTSQHAQDRDREEAAAHSRGSGQCAQRSGPPSPGRLAKVMATPGCDRASAGRHRAG